MSRYVHGISSTNLVIVGSMVKVVNRASAIKIGIMFATLSRIHVASIWE